jgi:hypothetical protein
MPRGLAPLPNDSQEPLLNSTAVKLVAGATRVAATSLGDGPHMRRDDARKLWRKLQDQGWKQVEPQWRADVDV